MGVEPFVTFGSREAAYLFYLTVSWLLAWGAYGLVCLWQRRDVGWPWHRVLGVVLVLWPFVRHVNLIWESFGAVLDTTSVATTVPEAAWWESVVRRWWMYVLLPLVGLFLATGQHLKHWPFHPVAGPVKATLLEADIRPGPGGWLRTLVDSCSLFVLFTIGLVMYEFAIDPFRATLETGDESAVFDALTPLLGFVLAVTAGVTEEVMFRGILQPRLARYATLWVAIPVQAVFFGLIHSGYGTISHILGPLLFGIFAGIVSARWGLVPVIAIHALIDLVVFWNTTARLGYDWTGVAVAVVITTIVMIPATYWGIRAARWLVGKGPSDAPPGRFG